MLLMALRGNVILYQGEELGLPQANVPFEFLRDPEALANWPQTLGRDGARTPLPWTAEADGGFGSASPWLPIDPAHLSYNVAAQAADRGSILNWTREMIALRRHSPALRSGDLRLLDETSDQIVAFERVSDDERLRCVFNLSNSPATCPPVSGVILATCGGADPANSTLAPAAGYIVRC
jgi:alpha-glucosidase